MVDSVLWRRLTSAAYRRVAAWTVVAALLAFGFAMTTVTLAGDDFVAMFPDGSEDSTRALGSGRWLMPVVWAVLDGNAFVPFFTMAVGLTITIAAGMVVAAAWRLTHPLAVFSVTALFLVNPTFSEPFSFEQHHVSYPLGLLLAAAAAWALLRWTRGRWVRIAVSGGLLSLSLAAYQPTALVFVVTVLGAEVLDRSFEKGWLRAAGGRVAGAGVASVAAVALYAVTVNIAWSLTGTGSHGGRRGRYSLTDNYANTPTEILDAMAGGVGDVIRFWKNDTTLYPLVLKFAGLALMAGGFVVMMSRLWRRWGAMTWVAAVGAATVLTPFTVLFVRVDADARTNVLTTVGLVVGLWAAVLIERDPLGGRRPRWLTPVVAAVVVFAVAASAFQIDKGFTGLYHANQRDLATANRMLSAMEQLPGYADLEEIRVALVGRVQYPDRGAPFTVDQPSSLGTSIVACDALSCQNQLRHLLRLVATGDRPFRFAGASALIGLDAEIAAMPVWPAPGSVAILGGVVVVKGSAD